MTIQHRKTKLLEGLTKLQREEFIRLMHKLDPIDIDLKPEQRFFRFNNRKKVIAYRLRQKQGQKSGTLQPWLEANGFEKVIGELWINLDLKKYYIIER